MLAALCHSWLAATKGHLMATADLKLQVREDGTFTITACVVHIMRDGRYVRTLDEVRSRFAADEYTRCYNRVGAPTIAVVTEHVITGNMGDAMTVAFAVEGASEIKHLPVTGRELELLRCLTHERRPDGRLLGVRKIAKRLDQSTDEIHETLGALERKGLIARPSKEVGTYHLQVLAVAASHATADEALVMTQG